MALHAQGTGAHLTDRNYPALTIAIGLLAFATLPLELGVGKVSLGIPLVLIFALLWLKYIRVPGRGFNGSALLIGTLIAGWAALRLTVLASVSGEQINWDTVAREISVLTVGLMAMALGRKPALHLAILRGAALCFCILLAQEFYQHFSGLDRLQAAGYTSDNGYYFSTLDGDYRPFGSFTGPTTFGTFLAMVGIWVALALKGKAGIVAALATFAGVLLTDTRAAGIGIVMALSFALYSSRELRRKAMPFLVLGFFAAVIGILLLPSLFDGYVERSLSALNASDTSRVTRLDLWAGVMQAARERCTTLAGCGSADWSSTMNPYSSASLTLGHAHSNFFQQWFRYGLVGALLFLMLMLTLVRGAIRGAREGSMYGAAATAATFIWLADSVFNNSLSSANFVLMAFLLAGCGALDRNPSFLVSEASCREIFNAKRSRTRDGITDTQAQRSCE